MLSAKNTLAVMIGGGAGAVCRVELGLAFAERLPDFPFGVLCANVLGCLLMGLFQGWMRRRSSLETAYCLFGTGFLGGFTTFSTFSMDTIILFRSGDFVAAGINIFANLLLCLAAVWGGYVLITPRRKPD